MSEISQPVFQLWMPLSLSIVIFIIGLVGVIFRKNIIVMLMSIELMLNSVNMVFVVFSKIHQRVDGDLMAIFIMTIAAAESAVGLGLIIALFRTLKTVNSDSIQILRD